MTNYRHRLLLALLLPVLLIACSKELSFEAGNTVPGSSAAGTLSGGPGDCANLSITGVYGQGLALDTSHKLLVEVTFTTEGTYTISTDTVNGVWFRASGNVSGPGTVVVPLQGYGSPLNPGEFTLRVSYRGSSCTIPFTVLPIQAAPAAGDYFPMSLNSNWTYQSSDPDATPADTFRSTSRGGSFNFPGVASPLALFEWAADGFLDSLYYRKAAGDYFQYGDLDLLGVFDLPVPGEFIFLKDNVPTGTVWTSAENTALLLGQQVKTRLRMELLAKDVDVAVFGKVYRNVIKVKVTQQVQLVAIAPYIDIKSFETWFARGIGLISVVADEPIYGYDLIRFQVN
jgi:hypothetical protein